MTNKTIGLFLLATTFLSSPAGAAALTPTPDTIKSEAADLIGNFALSELTGDLPAGAVEVKIGDKSYYFTPSGDDATLLATLAGTPAGSLVASENGIFELNSQKYGFDVASIPDSVFEYAEGTKDDYNFTVQEADAEGNLTDKYYKINLKPENFSTSKSITWTEVSEAQKDDKDDDLSDGKVSAVIAVRLPNDQTKYFQYTYTKPDNYTVTNTRINDTLGNANVTNVVFNGISSSEGKGGAIYNTQDNRDVNINADFIGNSATFVGSAYGGVIYNDDSGIIGNITGNFIGTSSASPYFYGGVIYNDGTIGNITGDFIRNSAAASSAVSSGGAIDNRGTIGDITGNFIRNSATSSSMSNGGAIYNKSAIGDITGNFIGNTAGKGGAIFNSGTIGDITGNFIANYASIIGGAINNGSTIDSITGDFIGNYSSNSHGYGGWGGAVYNSGTIDRIAGDFIGNHIDSYGMGNSAEGGAIYNSGTISNITGNFIGNYIQNDDSGSSNFMLGGAIRAAAASGNGSMTITGNFLYNYAVKNDKYNIQRYALGGAVYVGEENGPLTFKSQNQNLFFSGNYTKDVVRGKNYNAIFLDTYNLAINHVINFDTSGGGAWIVNDSIEGADTISWDMEGKIDYSRRYNLAFTGDGVLNEDGLTDQYISINNDIVNAGEVAVEGTTLRFGAYQHEDKTANNWDGHGRFVASLNKDGTVNLDAEAVTSLSLNNAAFDLYNEYQDTVNLKGWKASGDSYLHVDVDVENLTADMLNINGNVEGTTKLVLYPTSDKDIRGESILFAQSTNDTTGNADSFKVWRVYRSPYMFETKYTKTGKNANQWELEMNDTANDYAGVEPGERPDPEVPDVKPTPTPDKPTNPVYGEVVAYGALPAAAIEQTRSVVDNMFGQTAGRRSYCPGCGFYDYYWNGEGFRNLWINPTYYTSNIDSPFDADADVWGIEAGGDLQHDLNNKLGLFVSYRKGSYDMNGDGKHYYSTVGSEIDIDSYLAGLYYRYDRNNWYAFATLYGGIQQADIKTDDGVKSDTDGVEFGASLEAGYDYNLTDTVYLTPSLGVFYTQVNYDDATDNVGKKAEYNDLKQIELEAGVKLTKAFRLDEGYANVYVKPSVVQTLVDGDEVNITGLGKVNTLDDETLGRIELGGRYGFTDQLSAYGWANYTFGSDYDATTVGLGLNCAF